MIWKLKTPISHRIYNVKNIKNIKKTIWQFSPSLLKSWKQSKTFLFYAISFIILMKMRENRLRRFVVQFFGFDAIFFNLLYYKNSYGDWKLNGIGLCLVSARIMKFINVCFFFAKVFYVNEMVSIVCVVIYVKRVYYTSAPLTQLILSQISKTKTKWQVTVRDSFYLWFWFVCQNTFEFGNCVGPKNILYY